MLNLQKNYLEKYQQIYPENPEWGQIQYRLQLNLGNSSAYLKKVYSVYNPHLNAQFEKQNKGHIIYQALVNTNEKGSNRVQRVCQKGFEFPSDEGGLEFTIGQIQMDPKQKNEYELLIVKLCPKKSYPCYEKQLDKLQRGCPQGFQSIYYVDNHEKESLYRHRFRLFKKNQVVPMYVIQFRFNQEHEKAFKEKICEKCQNEVAKIFCTTQNVFFCKKCDYLHHKDRISAKHERNLLNERPILDFGKCRNHPGNKNELFCQNCSNSMCMSCKIYGDHSQESMGNHKIFKIQDYYIGAIKKIEEIDPSLDKRKYQLQKLLCYLDDQIDVINSKTSQLQKQLKEYFERALTELETISKHKLSILMGDQLEVRRQYDYIQWMESFLIYEKNVLPPNDFLIAWTKHERLRKEVLNIANIPSVTQVEPNMKILGNITVEMIDSKKGGDDGEFNKKPVNQHLDKYTKSSGGKGPAPKQLQVKHEKFRKKLIFFNDDQ